MSIWKRHVPVSLRPMPDAAPPLVLNQHSFVAGNGQHYVLPTRSGGIAWFGHKNSVPQASAFSPSESFEPHAVGLVPAAAPIPQTTTSAAVRSMTGVAAGRSQLSPGGGAISTVPPAQG